MVSRLYPPLVPRNNRRLKVLGIGRISTIHQDGRSLEDQQALNRNWLESNYDGDLDFIAISTQDSGEAIDRVELQEMRTLVEANTLDLVIMEDLGRYCRRIHVHEFLELCEDHGVRLVAINDHIDTAIDGWKFLALLAAFRHESYNADTGKRIRRSLRNRFLQGGVFQFEVYGYIKLPGAKGDSDVQKDPDAEKYIQGIFERLEKDASFAEVADWLNENNVRPGPYCRRGRWDGTLVSRLVRNPILKGVRVRNRKVSKRVNRTGRHRSVNAPPEELLERNCPHLAFIDPERYDRVLARIESRNAKYRRKLVDGHDSRANVPKKKTRWPGQAITCGVCGRMLHFGGNGVPKSLCCSGVNTYRCWNTIGVNGRLAADKLVAEIYGELESIEDFDEILFESVNERLRMLAAAKDVDLADATNRRMSVDKRLDSCVLTLEQTGPSEALTNRIRELEMEKRTLAETIELIRNRPHETLKIPEAPLLRQMAIDAMKGLAVDNPEFNRLMAKLVPRITVFPYRMIDDGAMVLRAEVDLQLAPFVSVHPEIVDDCRTLLQRRIIVDLFDPPQREKHRIEIVRLRAGGMTEQKAADQLGITRTAAQRAVRLQRQMDRLGITDPYIRMHAPPDNTAKNKRHRHSRFRFEPLPGFPVGA